MLSLPVSNLRVAKSRVTPTELAIPSLELIAAHIFSRLISNVKSALKVSEVKGCYGWVDSTIMLFRLYKTEAWSTYVLNRAETIQKE